MVQKLDDNKIEYLLITIQKGKKSGKADVFYSLSNKESMKILIGGLNEFSKEVDKFGDEMDKEDE
jgi:hypothetical protein